MRRFCLVAAFLCCAGCQLWVEQYAADREDAVSINTLCAVGASRYEFELDLESNEHWDTLEEYYAEANPDFIAHFTSVGLAYDAGTQLHTATYIIGEAGVGKSFVMRRLLEAFPKMSTCDLSLVKTLSVSSDRIETTRLADLATIDGSVVFNELPALSMPDAFSLNAYLEQHNCAASSLILLDGIDEVHPTSARAILRSIEDYLTKTDAPFVHIVVTGRPEGFSPWLADPMRGDRTGELATLLRLKAPAYDTRGDVAFRLQGYLAFAELLQEVEREGRLEDYTENVVGYLQREPFLRYSLGNLAVGNVVLQHTMTGAGETPRNVQDKVFADLVARNSNTHGRPGVGSRFDATYLEALEDIAVRYVDVNNRGEFTVGPNDEVPVFDVKGERLGMVLVRSLLERSGLAYQASPTSTTKRFSFSPFWIHAYLVERRNERVVPRYEATGCP